MTAVTIRQAGTADLAAIARLRRMSAQEQDGEPIGAQADPGFEAACSRTVPSTPVAIMA